MHFICIYYIILISKKLTDFPKHSPDHIPSKAPNSKNLSPFSQQDNQMRTIFVARTSGPIHYNAEMRIHLPLFISLNPSPVFLMKSSSMVMVGTWDHTCGGWSTQWVPLLNGAFEFRGKMGQSHPLFLHNNIRIRFTCIRREFVWGMEEVF